MVIRDMAPNTAAGRGKRRGRAEAVDSRRLPLYAAGEIDVPFVVYGTDEVIARDTYWEEHSHPTHELLWNQHGASTARIGARMWTVTPSVGLWIPAGTLHSGWTPAGTWHHAAQFGIHAVPAIADTPVAVEVTPLLRLLLERLNTEGLAADSRARTEALVLDLLAPAPVELLLKIPDSSLLAPIVSAVRADPADDTTLAAWAVRLDVSGRTITRAFRAQTGLGFSQWLAAARVQHAITLLCGGEEIEEVAERVGYHSASAFGTVFRRVTGMSPGRFRAQ